MNKKRAAARVAPIQILPGHHDHHLLDIYYFFQAEDGIRDWSLTGVQTCALPISSYATRSRSDAATGASGGRTGPPYNPPPTASMAALTPAGPSFPTTSLSSGASRSCSFPAPSRSPARKAANTWAESAAAKQATARMPPSQPSSRAAYKSEPEPTKTDHCGAASRYAARFLASPDESLTPTMLAWAASCRRRPAAIGRCVYLGML